MTNLVNNIFSNLTFHAPTDRLIQGMGPLQRKITGVTLAIFFALSCLFIMSRMCIKGTKLAEKDLETAKKRIPGPVEEPGIKKEQEIKGAKKALEEETALKAHDEEASAKKALEEEVALKAQDEEAAVKKALEEEATIKAQEKEASAKKALEEEAALKAQDERAAVKKALEEEATLKAQEKEIAAKKALEEEAALKAQEKEATAKKALEEEATLKAQEKEVAAKKVLEEEAALKAQKKEATAKKALEGAPPSNLSRGFRTLQGLFSLNPPESPEITKGGSKPQRENSKNRVHLQSLILEGKGVEAQSKGEGRSKVEGPGLSAEEIIRRREEFKEKRKSVQGSIKFYGITRPPKKKEQEDEVVPDHNGKKATEVNKEKVEEEGFKQVDQKKGGFLRALTLGRPVKPTTRRPATHRKSILPSQTFVLPKAEEQKREQDPKVEE